MKTLKHSAAGVPGSPSRSGSPQVPASDHASSFSVYLMKKDCRYYEAKIQEILEQKYNLIANKMAVDGKSREEIVQAIRLQNAKDLHHAKHIGEDPSTN